MAFKVRDSALRLRRPTRLTVAAVSALTLAVFEQNVPTKALFSFSMTLTFWNSQLAVKNAIFWDVNAMWFL
jgi:hypothetical protein